TLTSFGEWR
nr:RecName: Full=Snake venom metalloproteinase BleucMP; Short=SVMP [Bothrops leucurus]